MKKYSISYYPIFFIVLFFVSCNATGKNFNDKNFDCQQAQNKIEDYIRKYKSSKDTNYLLTALPIIDTALKYCEQKQYFFENKVWVYRCLKKYDTAIELINSTKCENNFQLYENSFGKNYYLKSLYIVKYNAQNDTMRRDQCIKQLIIDMKLSFDIYNNIHIDSSEFSRLKCIPSVNPTKYEALLAYYTIRMLLENKDKLIQEIEKISIENDFEDHSLKNDLEDLIKNGSPQKFYE